MTASPLSAYSRNVTSQFGEDGIIAEIFRRISPRSRICVEFGAWDGKYLSNTWDLWHNQGWSAVLIEGDAKRHRDLCRAVRGYKSAVAIHAFVTPDGESSLDQILVRLGSSEDIDLLSVDIDGDEYYVLQGLNRVRPRVLVVEYNPTIPPELSLVQVSGDYFGASARALVEIAKSKGYGFVCCTQTNCIFVDGADYPKLAIAEPDLVQVFFRENLTYVVNAYDGATFLSRNPMYSPQIPDLDANLLYSELQGALRGRRSQADHKISPQGALTPVRIFAVPRLLSRKATIWRRAAGRLRRTLVGNPLSLRLRNAFNHWSLRREEHRNLERWAANGRPVPPPHQLKRNVLREYAKRHGIRVLVETGTYMGEMVHAMREQFDTIFSIELAPELYKQAADRFAAFPNVNIVYGDSATMLPEILGKITEPALFWLDGHYSEGNTAKGSKDTPILSELEAVYQHPVKHHVVLIDDARCFNGTGDYPTLSELERFVRLRLTDASFEVKDDIIRIF